MNELVIVAFLSVVDEGFTFERSAWPPHITVVRFDTALSLSQVRSRVRRVVRGASGVRSSEIQVVAGADAQFGRRGTVAVSLIEPNEQLIGLQAGVVTGLDIASSPPATYPHQHAYRPHITHTPLLRPREGQRFVLAQLALVDRAPDGDRRYRRVLSVWNVG